MFCCKSIKVIFNNISILFSKMEELDIQSKPSEEITDMSDIPDDLSHKSMAVMENKSIRATTDTEREANSLESDTCHWRDMLKLCTPLSIRLTHLSKDILKKFTTPKKNATQRLSGSLRNLVMDSRDYRSRKRKKKNVGEQFKYSRRKQKAILDQGSHPNESVDNSIPKSCTITSTNDNASTAPACGSEEHIRSEKIINEAATDKVLDVPISMEQKGKNDTSSVQCLNENAQEHTQVEKNNTETEESRYQEYVRNILMEYCYSYGNLSHMSKEMNDNENSSDTKSTVGDKRRSNENCSDDQIPSWNSRKRRKKAQLNSKDETIVNRKSPKKKQQQRNQKNLRSTPTKDDGRRSVFVQQTKSPSCTPPKAEQEIGKTGADSPRKLKIQLMKLEDVSGMYAPIESTDMILENERDVSSSMNNDNDSVVGSEGISDAETVVNSMFTEESRNANEIQESDHALDSIPIIAFEKKSDSGSEISDVPTERDLEMIEKQRKTSMSSDETVHQNSEADNYINEADEAIDLETILRLRFGIRKDPIILLEKLDLTRNVPTVFSQYDHDVSDVLEESDSSSDSEIFMFVRKRKSPSMRSRRISSSSEEEQESSIKPVATPVSNKDEDIKNRSPSSRTANTREETSEVFVTKQTSGTSKDTSLEGSEHVATISSPVKDKVSQPENTKNLSPKNVVKSPKIIEYNSDTSDSDIQILSVTTMNSNVPPETCETIEINSPSTVLDPKESLSNFSTDNTASAVTSQANETPIVNTESPVKNTQTSSGSKITPVTTTPKLSCHICNRKYVRKRSLKIHMELQHNNDPSKKFSKPETSSCSTQECNSANETLDCGICSKKFVSKKEFVDHVFNHQSEAQQDYRTAPDKRSRSVWLDLYGLKDKNAEEQHVEKSKKDKKDSSSDKRIRKEEQIISSLTASPKEVVVCPCHPNNGLLNEQGSSVYIEMVLLCEHCNVVFRRKECLETHYRVSAQCSVNRTSGRVPKLYCTACNVTVESLSVLRHHLEMHPRLQVRGIVTFLCNICKVIFFGIGSIFRRHWFSHIKNPLFVASRHSFPKISVMKALENYNVSAEERMQVAQAAELAENIKYVLIAEHVCRNCKLPFGSEADLTNHSTSCSDLKNVSNAANASNDGTTCSTCQKSFTDKSNYDIHVGNCHAMADGSSPVKSKDTSHHDSDISHMTCQTEDQLKLHRNSHSSAGPFSCSRCGTSFSTVEPFTAHTKATCTICDKQFDCQKRCQDHLSSHFTNLAVSEKPQESSTKTLTSCETNFEVDKGTANKNHVESTKVTVSPGCSSLQATRSAESQQSKSQTEVRYLIIRDEITKLPKQVVTITSAGSTSNASCISKEAEQQTSILNEIISINNAIKNVTNIVEIQPANIEKDPLASAEEKDTATTMDTEVPTDSSETSSTAGMPRGSKNEKTPTSGFLRVKSMSELLEKRDKKSYICKTCGLPCTSAENLAEHSSTHVTHQMANEKAKEVQPPSANEVQRTVDQDSLRLLNQYITSNKFIIQPIRSNLTNASSNNFNTEVTTNVNNTQQANKEGVSGNVSAFIPCVICGTVFNATENPIHCQTAATSTGQANTHTNARVYQPVANNQTQSIEIASTFNTAVRHSPFVTYTSNTVGREPPVSAVNSVNVNLNMNQQVARAPQNSQWTNLTYDTTNVPIAHSQVPTRLPPPYSAPTNIHSNTLPKNTNGSTTATVNSHCLVPNPPMRPQYPYRAVSQSGNKSVPAKPSNSSFSTSTAFANNNAQTVTTDAPIGSTRPHGYSMNYGIVNVPLQQSQSDIILRTESHVTRKPAHQSVSHTIHQMPEQPGQPGSQRPGQICNFINQPKTTQAYQQTSQKTTREQQCIDLSTGLIFTCPSCKDFTCTTAEELRLHRTQHLKPQQIQPSKSYCTSTSDVEPGPHSSSYSITNQQVRSTSNEPLYVCNKCHTFRTTNHVELQDHMKQHHKSYICQLCHIYKCKSATQMQDHINLHIDGKIAPHAVRNSVQIDGKVVSKIQPSQQPFSESSHSAGIRSSSVHPMQPTQVRSKQYSQCEYRGNDNSQVLAHESNANTLNSCSKKVEREWSGFKKTVYYFCKVCTPTPVFQTAAELERHQASLHP